MRPLEINIAGHAIRMTYPQLASARKTLPDCEIAALINVDMDQLGRWADECEAEIRAAVKAREEQRRRDDVARIQWEAVEQERRRIEQRRRNEQAEKRRLLAELRQDGPHSKLTDAWRRRRNRKIMEMWLECDNGAAVARAFGMNTGTVWAIINRSRRSMSRACRAYMRQGPTQSRPIDMGGRRDEWHVWTPEKQYREMVAG